MRRYRLKLFLVFPIVILFSVAILTVAAIKFQPLGFAEKAATYFMKRSVSMGTAEFDWGSPFTIKLSDVRVANQKWGSQPNMIEIGDLNASIEVLPLLVGTLKFDDLSINGATILLEHGPDGRGNWKKQNSPPATPSDSAERAKKSRKALPTILNLVMRNSHIVFRTSGGATLKIDFNNLKLQTPGDDQPVSLDVVGAYNDIPVDLTIVSQSFDQLHDSDALFEATVHAEGATTSVKLDAHMMDPLNFDQIDSKLDVHVKNVGEMAALFGGAFSWKIPLHFKSALKRNNDIWNFDDAEGDIAGNRFEHSHLQLIEGKPKQSDNIEVSFDFKAFDIQSVMAGSDKNNKSDDNILRFLDVADNPSTLVKVTIKSDETRFGNFHATQLQLTGSIQPNRAALDHVSTLIAGGSLSASLVSKTRKTGSDITADAQLLNLNSKQLFTWLGLDNKAIDGNMDIELALTGKSKTLTELKETLQGTAAISAVGGHLSRHLIRLASEDVKALFDDNTPLTGIECFVAILHFADGIGSLSPFELKTDVGTLRGAGQVDLPANFINLKFQTDPDTTSALALDIPVIISGPFENPSVVPAANGMKFGSQDGDTQPHFAHAGFSTGNSCYLGPR